MLSFQERDILAKFGYNKKEMSESLSTRMEELHKAEQKLEESGKFTLPIADKIFGNPIRKVLQNIAENNVIELNTEWNKLCGTDYPNVKLKDGTIQDTRRFLDEHSPMHSTTKDGWYHIPDNLCCNASERSMRDQFETECNQTGKRIPYEIGKRMETIFLQAKINKKDLWVHRTGLSIDGGDLASIAKNGLIVPTQGYGEKQTPDLENTATHISMNFNGFTHLLRVANLEEYKQMRGTVICQTEKEPKIADGYLHADQLVGYVARDEKGQVCKFLEPADMESVHNTKTVIIDGKTMEIDRKSNSEIIASDYRSCDTAYLGKTVTFINDTYGHDPMQFSIVYGANVYGNLEAFLQDINVTKEQEETMKNLLQDFAKDQEKELQIKHNQEQEKGGTKEMNGENSTKKLQEEYVQNIVKGLDKEFEKVKEEIEELKQDEYYSEHSDDRELAIDNLYEEYNKEALEDLDRAIDRGVDRDGLVKIAECACVENPEKTVDDRLAEIEYEEALEQEDHETTQAASAEEPLASYRTKMEELIDNKEIVDKLCDNMKNFAERMEVVLDEAEKNGQELSDQDREKIGQDIYVNEGYSDIEHGLIEEYDRSERDGQEIEDETPDLDDDLVP